MVREEYREWLVRVDVNKNEEQQHEAGMDTVIKDPLQVSDGDKCDDAQIENEANTSGTNSITSVELQGEPMTDDSPTAVELNGEEEQSITDEIELITQEVDAGEDKSPSSLASLLDDRENERKLIETTNVNNQSTSAEETPLAPVKADTPDELVQETEDPNSTNPSNGLQVTQSISAKCVNVVDDKQQLIIETNLHDEHSPAEADVADQDDLDSQQSSESLPPKPLGFLESLTANFAPDTKALWTQIFGQRNEDEPQDWKDDSRSNVESTSTRGSVASKSSLQAKLARERKLDEQIQASQRRYRERVLRNKAVNNSATRRSRNRHSGQSQGQTSSISLFEQVGFSLTQIRFCMEKALHETCKCFRQIHAEILEEAEDLANPPTRGIYITQGELDQLLRELFDPCEPPTARSRKGTLVIPLDFARNGEFSLVDGTMSTQLQASWFIPFGQLPHLRLMVMKITKRHLDDQKLKMVNQHLQNQLTLFPLSRKLQDLVLQLSNFQRKEPLETPNRSEGCRSPDQVFQQLLGSIGINEAVESVDYTTFLHFLPLEIISTLKFSSVVCAQRLVFFRYLIEVIAAASMRLQSNPTKPFAPALSDNAPPKRKSFVSKLKKSFKRVLVDAAPESDATTQDNGIPADNEETTSVRTSQTTSEAVGVNHENSAENDWFNNPDQGGDENEKPASQLQPQLESAINQLQQTLPTIDLDTSNAAIRTMYLAAVACHQSVLFMLENSIDVNDIMSDKLKHFIEALTAIQIETGVQVFPVDTEKANDQLLDPPRYPPPYPESPVTEVDEDSKTDIDKTILPPPYDITTPSYWTFNPSIPEPKSTTSSISKSASKSLNSKPTEIRSSPDDSAYHIQQSEKLAFEPKSSYSFGENFIKGIITPAFSLDSDRVPGTSRAHVESQYDDSHIGVSNLDDLPPSIQDANGTFEEKANGDAAEDTETVMDLALRLQQRIFMGEFVQQVVSNQESPTFVLRDNVNTDSTQRPSSKSKPYWATYEVSPDIERLLLRQRKAPSSSKSRPTTASIAPIRPRTTRTTKRVVLAAPPSPRRQHDNDQHLAWAARISELYHSTAPEQ